MIDRPSSRLLVVDAEGRLLLFRFEHGKGALAGSVYWATPGGGLDPGESYEQAACREAFEELGLRIDDPGPQVLRREVRLTLPDGQMADADERFFLLRVDALPVSQRHWTELEREVMVAHRWWTADELRATLEQVFPDNLAKILADIGVS
jgi:8-oxo-dGTP pyrophosphatase MutT (NUDIX family)